MNEKQTNALASEVTLLMELETIDALVAAGRARPKDEHRGQELVDLANRAPALAAECARLREALQKIRDFSSLE